MQVCLLPDLAAMDLRPEHSHACLTSLSWVLVRGSWDPIIDDTPTPKFVLFNAETGGAQTAAEIDCRVPRLCVCE